MKRKYDNLLQAIGNTPLVKLNFDTPAQIYAKLEYLNPGGSIKDRAALFMIEQAEKTGRLKPGGTIIEASSGNQGIASALIGAVKGYKVIVTVSEKVSTEKKKTLEAYGVTIILCKPTTFLEDSESYHSVAVKLHQNTPNSFLLNQYFNPENSLAHYSSLGPEIWDQTQGMITHFCGALGTGGTVSGTGKFLKEKNTHIRILGVDALNSYRSTQGNPLPYKMEGIGVDFNAPLLNGALINDFLLVTDEEVTLMLKTLARTYGLLVGPSSGAVAHAIYKYSKLLNKNDLLVMVFGDSGRAYLTKDFYW